LPTAGADNWRSQSITLSAGSYPTDDRGFLPSL
jgi:hypothetical protein